MSTAKKIIAELGRRSTLVDLTFDNNRTDLAQNNPNRSRLSRSTTTSQLCRPSFRASFFLAAFVLLVISSLHVSSVNAFDFNNLINSYNSQRVLSVNTGKTLEVRLAGGWWPLTLEFDTRSKIPAHARTSRPTSPTSTTFSTTKTMWTRPTIAAISVTLIFDASFGRSIWISIVAGSSTIEVLASSPMESAQASRQAVRLENPTLTQIVVRTR